jgi:hypothetical protein
MTAQPKDEGRFFGRAPAVRLSDPGRGTAPEPAKAADGRMHRLDSDAEAAPALQAFARTDPHRTIMRRVRPWAKTATFRFWTVPAGKLVPAQLWAESESRITAPAH